MTYLDRPPPPKGPPWAHNSLGASVHNALANWWRLPRAERTVPSAGRLLERGWISDGFASDAQAVRQMRRAKGMVEAYVARLDPDCEPAGVERTVATKTKLIAVSGRIDRLDDRQGRGRHRDATETDRTEQASPGQDRQLVVVDYKTGRQPITVDEVRSSMALALYALAAGRVLRRPCQRVELHHLPTAEVVGWEHTAESLDRHLRRAEDIAGECAAGDEQFRAEPETGRGDEVFPPRPGSWCGWCDYRAHCQEGQLASAQRKPWDGLREDDTELAG
jgi:RecB family exonuclease